MLRSDGRIGTAKGRAVPRRLENTSSACWRDVQIPRHLRERVAIHDANGLHCLAAVGQPDFRGMLDTTILSSGLFFRGFTHFGSLGSQCIARRTSSSVCRAASRALSHPRQHTAHQLGFSSNSWARCASW